MNRKTMYVGIIAALAAQAAVADAAQRVDLGSQAASRSMLGRADIYTLANAAPDDLQMAHVQELGKSRLVRFDQYHLGVPVFGGALVIETDGSAAEGAVKQVKGGLLRGLDYDLPSRRVSLNEIGALDVARRALRVDGMGDPPDAENTAHLYVWRDGAGKARLVYVVSLTLADRQGKRGSRPTLIVDANTSAVLDRWESLDRGDGMGPGGYLRPVAKSLSARGWNQKRIQLLFAHATNLYQAENSPMASTSCGAVEAAQDLGFPVNDVRAAFSIAGFCRSNARKYTLRIGGADGDDPTPRIASAQEFSTLATTTTALSTKYGTWRRFTRNDFTLLPGWDTADENLAKTKSALGIPSTSTTRVDVIYINNMNISKNNGFQTSSLDYCSRMNACVDIRMNASGSRSQSDTYTAWSRIRALTPFQYPATPHSTAITLNSGAPWSTANTTASSWSYTVSSEVSVGATIGFSDSFGANFNVTFGVSASRSGEQSKTYTNNFFHGSYRIPAGCYALITPVERWKQRYDYWTVRPQVQGRMEARTYPNWNGSEYTEYNATSHFNNLPTIPTYQMTLNDRTELINSVTVVGKRFSDGSACTLTAL